MSISGRDQGNLEEDVHYKNANNSKIVNLKNFLLNLKIRNQK